MKLRKLISVLTAVSIAATTLTLQESSVYAANTFATVNDFISDVVTTALAGITSTTKDTAITTVLADVSTYGDSVTYKGTAIGYWDSADSATLWTDSSKTNKVIEESGEGYKVKPSLLTIILSDVNEAMVESTPADEVTDWRKVVGKQDIRLGTTVVPADQWIPMTPEEDPYANNNWVDLTRLVDFDGSELNNLYYDKTFFIMGYMIDSEGKLYLQDTIMNIGADQELYRNRQWGVNLDSLTGIIGHGILHNSEGVGYDLIAGSKLKVGLSTNSDGGVLTTGFAAVPYVTDSAHTTPATDITPRKNSSAMRRLDDNSFTNTEDLTDAYQCGLVWMTGYQVEDWQSDGQRKMHTWHTNFFVDSAAIRVGNTSLERKIRKLTALEATDFVLVENTSWTVNGTEDIDSYLALEELGAAGDTADISAVADIDPLCFKVIVPTMLPIYVDSLNSVSVASNATITNKSGAAVKITDVEIVPKQDSGWTLVDSKPAHVRDAKEFKFETSLAVNTRMVPDEVLPFTYTAELSPLVSGAEALDLAIISVTVDWADM